MLQASFTKTGNVFQYYEISGGYRFCSNICRHHKSNNVRFDVDLNFGFFEQTCHDPDCRNYR